VPICSKFIRAALKNSGKSPHAIPSFRLLTRPAWLTLDRFLSRRVVLQNTSRCVGVPSPAGVPCSLDSAVAWCRVSRTTNAESRSPTTTKPTPK
jgi:hypothetical protein